MSQAPGERRPTSPADDNAVPTRCVLCEEWLLSYGRRSWICDRCNQERVSTEQDRSTRAPSTAAYEIVWFDAELYGTGAGLHYQLAGLEWPVGSDCIWLPYLRVRPTDLAAELDAGFHPLGSTFSLPSLDSKRSGIAWIERRVIAGRRAPIESNLLRKRLAELAGGRADDFVPDWGQTVVGSSCRICDVRSHILAQSFCDECVAPLDAEFRLRGLTAWDSLMSAWRQRDIESFEQYKQGLQSGTDPLEARVRLMSVDSVLYWRLISFGDTLPPPFDTDLANEAAAKPADTPPLPPSDNARIDYGRYLASREFGLKKRQLRQRSGGICEHCRAAPYQDTHHMTYERLGREELDDLLAVCRACHEFLSGRTDYNPRTKSTEDPG